MVMPRSCVNFDAGLLVETGMPTGGREDCVVGNVALLCSIRACAWSCVIGGEVTVVGIVGSVGASVPGGCSG